jgi:hypothetical protein
MKKIIVGLIGRAGAGKDTVAKMLEAYLNLFSVPSKSLAFADPLYATVDAMFPCNVFCPNLNITSWRELPRREKETYQIPGTGKTLRQILQTLGTEWGRECINSQIWLNLMHLRIRHRPERVFLLTDVRFPNEAAFIKDYEVLSSHPWGESTSNTEYTSLLISVSRLEGEHTPHSDHASETSQSSIDEAFTFNHTISNNSTLEDLQKEVQNLGNTIISTLYDSTNNKSVAGQFHD